MIEVKFTDPAKEQFRSLEKDIRLRIYDKLEETKSWPEHYLVRLKGYPYYKLRIGDSGSSFNGKGREHNSG